MDPMVLIPIHFEQLKELRNGTISYVQIIKRDQTRPPVRPVCRKLGVSKLSEIKNEAEMYDALLSVAQGQSMKVQNMTFGNNGSPGHYSSSENGLYALDTDTTVASPRSSRFSAGPFSSVSEPTAPELGTLLECVLHIRQSWDPRDRSQRLAVFAARYGLEEPYLLAVLQRVCEILGCAHISELVDADLVVNATKICYKQFHSSSRPSIDLNDSTNTSPRDSVRLHVSPFGHPHGSYGYSPHPSPRPPVGDSSAKLLAMTPRPEPSPRYVNDDLSARMWSMGLSPSEPQQDMLRGLRTTPVDRRNIAHAHSADEQFASYGFLPSPRPRAVTIDVSANAYSPSDASSLASARHEGALFSSRSSDLRTTPVQWHSQPRVQAPGGSLLPQCESFWYQAMQLLRAVVDPSARTAQALAMVAELAEAVHHSVRAVPALAVALDIVTKKAFVELNKKIELAAESSQIAVSLFEPKPAAEKCADVLRALLIQAQDERFASVQQVHSFCWEPLLREFTEQRTWARPSNGTGSVSDAAAAAGVDTLDESLTKLATEDNWTHVCESARATLANLLEICHEGDSQVFSIALGGAALVGAEVDLVASSDQLTKTEQLCNARLADASRRLSSVESALETELQHDALVRLLQDTLAEFRAAVQEDARNHSQGPRGVALSPNQAARALVAGRMLADAEPVARVGDRLVESAILEAQARRSQPQLAALLDQLSVLRAQVRETTATLDKARAQALFGLVQRMTQAGYVDVQVAKRYGGLVARFVHLNEAAAATVQCCVSVGRPLALESAQFVDRYFRADTSGTASAFAALVQQFAKGQSLTQELSPHAWNILSLHFLLRFGYLSAGQLDLSSNAAAPFACEERLKATGVSALLSAFCAYLSSGECDLTSHVLTARVDALLLPKADWSKRGSSAPVRWRLALEDPVDTSNTADARACDLAASLSVEGQTRVLRALRMGRAAIEFLRNQPNLNTLAFLTDPIQLQIFAIRGGYSDTAQSCSQDGDSVQLSHPFSQLMPPLAAPTIISGAGASAQSPSSAGSGLTDRDAALSEHSERSLTSLVECGFLSKPSEDVSEISPRLASWLRQSPKQTV